MWMTKEVITVTPEVPAGEIARIMVERNFRRLPVADADGKLLGMVTSQNVLHAFPANVNPFTFVASEHPDIPALHMRADQVMVPELLTTTPEAPIEEAARIMRDRKTGVLLVMRNEQLLGIITESDLFRAFTSLFDPGTQGVRITFDNSAGQDVFPLIAEVTHRHRLRVMSFVSMHKHERPLCVVQVTGTPKGIEAMLNDIWKSHHQVVSVIHLDPEAQGK
ncbi:MAG: CBS domain-containing protein [Steroidobacteraceae bacterium]